MEPKDIFSQLKTISPRKEFTEHSRRLIVSSQSNSHSPYHYARLVFADIFRMGTAIALTSALLLLIVNATFLWKVLPAPQVAVLDPVGLHAEAQAIDIQIHLAQLNFDEFVMHSSTESTAPISPGTRDAQRVGAPQSNSNVQMGDAAAQGLPANASKNNPTSTLIDIDSALRILGE